MSLFGGSGGTNTTQNSFSYYTPHFYTPYQNAADQAITNVVGGNGVQGLENAPYQAPMQPSAAIAPLNATQNQAGANIAGVASGYQPWFSNAYSSLQPYQGVNPINMAAPYFSQANATPSAQMQSQPYFSQAGQTFPQVSSSYMNPYIDQSVNAANKLASQNFTQNVMPSIASGFVASGGGLGSSAYDNAMNWGLTNFNQNIDLTTQQALASGWNNANNAFQSDASRLANLGSSAGNLALGQQGMYGNLGTMVGNNAATGIGSGINLGTAYGNLGANYTNTGLAANQALMGWGNQQQQQAQAPLSLQYQQATAAQQWPYQTNAWGANVLNSYQWPNAYSTNSQTNSQTTGGQSGSVLGSILGGLATVGSLAIPGAGGMSAFGNIFGGLGGLLGGGGGGGQQYGPPAPATNAKRGGHFAFAEGGHFGGYDPVAMRRSMGRDFWGGRRPWPSDNSWPQVTKPAFADTYAAGGPAPVSSIPQFLMTQDTLNALERRARGGWLSGNETAWGPRRPWPSDDSWPPVTKPMYRDTYATGGHAPFVNVMQDRNREIIQATRAFQNRQQMNPRDF